MKKALLLATAALLSASAAFAETRYFQAGDPITDISQMKDDDHNGLYFLQAYQNLRKKSGFYHPNSASNRFVYTTNDVTTISELGETNKGMVFQIAFVEDETDAFTVKNYSTNQFLSTQGQNGVGKHNAVPCNAGANNIAHFTLIPIPAGSAILNENDPLKDYRWVVESTNAYFDGNQANGRFHWFSNDLENGGALTYHQDLYVNGNAQVAFIPVKEVESRTATVTLPALTGTGTITRNVEVFDDYSAEPYIQLLIEELGGITDLKITSDTADDDLTVSENNVAFTVTGNWIEDFEANQVYRLCVNPADSPSALRYMLYTGELRTRVDGVETLSRLIPERLWFFKKTDDGENTYTIHNLYDIDLGVHFDANTNNALASYGNNPTVFEYVATEHANQFYLKVNGTENAYVCENNEMFTIKNIATPDASCLIQFYPLEGRDMEALNLSADTPHTYESVKDAVADYNAQNIAAAVRRIEYWGGENLVGWQPGRFNNAAGDFHIKLQEAKDLLAQGDDADPAAVEQAVKDINFENLTVFNAIKPGMFYRFKNKTSGKYISSITNGPHSVGNPAISRTFMELVTSDNANRSNTVFYIDGPEEGPWTIVSFDSGLVLPTFNSTSETWCPVVKGTENASAQYNIVHQHLGGCVIHASDQNGHRHLYGGEKSSPTGVVLASGNATDDDHQWYIELVESLPIPLYNTEDATEAWASVHSPVALQIENGEAIVHTGKFTGSAVWRNAYLAGDVVPANTSVLLDYKGGAEDSNRREGISYIYVKPLYGQEPQEAMLFDVEEPETPVAEHKDLNGGIYAIASDENTHYYTLHETNHNNFRQYSDTDYIPGFKAHIAIPASADNQESFAIIDDPSTEINEVSTEATAVKAIYDLQGRKLAAPSKGINIVNGVKVLVK